eukprot:COSAG06_NODE_3671_length_5036_cov_3.267977_7_plen_93_part_00
MPTKECYFGAKCTNKKCTFGHPWDARRPGNFASNSARKKPVCCNGATCRDATCVRWHEGENVCAFNVNPARSALSCHSMRAALYVYFTSHSW